MSRIHDALRRAEEKSFANLSAAAEGVEAKPEVPLPDMVQLADLAMAESLEREIKQAEKAAAPSTIPSLQNHPKTVWSPTREALFLTAESSASAGLEEFRTLRSKLFQIRAKRPLNSILVSSALPGEGKSFVSANLAQAFARQKGGRTLLIDADMRRPQLHEVLGAPSQPGLFEYLSGTASETEILQRSSISDELFFIPAGNITANAAEMVGTDRVKVLLERLATVFNWIVIDSSPVGPVSDATRLAEYCDGVLLVIKAESTSHVEAERAKREFHQSALLGVVFNRSSQKSLPSYKYSYHPLGLKVDSVKV